MSEHRRRVGLAAAVAGVLVGGLGVAVSTVAAESATREPAAPQVIEVLGKRNLFTLSQTAGVGVPFLAGGELTDAGQARVGEALSSCVVVRLNPAVPPGVLAHCASTFRFKEGDLHLAGLREYTDGRFKDTALAVLGGTGKFQTARGEAKTSVVDPQHNVYKFTITLSD